MAKKVLALLAILCCNCWHVAAQNPTQPQISQSGPPRLKDDQDSTKSLQFTAYHGKVVEVASGNTLSVKTDDKKLNIRLLGIDVPVKGQGHEAEARNNLTSLVLNKEVDILVPQDKTGNLKTVVPAKVMLAGQDVGLLQVRGGYGWLNAKDDVYLSQKEHKLYGEAQRYASDNKLGQWHCPEAASRNSSQVHANTTEVKAEESDPEAVGGTVAVEIIVDESGKVISAKAMCGHPLLQQAAVEAAYQARFTPTLLEGKPVKVQGYITYNFVPQKKH